jgi:hypothetical protein
LLRPIANGGQLDLDPVRDGQVDLALCIVEFALLADKVGLSLLRFGELRVSLL